MNTVNDCSSLGKTHSLSFSIGPSDPARINEPHSGVVFFTHLGEKFGINKRVERQECFTKASGESRFR